MNTGTNQEGISLTIQGAKRLYVRMRAPYFKKMNGMGASTAAISPMSVQAHCMPNYMRTASVRQKGTIDNEHLHC